MRASVAVRLVIALRLTSHRVDPAMSCDRKSYTGASPWGGQAVFDIGANPLNFHRGTGRRLELDSPVTSLRQFQSGRLRI